MNQATFMAKLIIEGKFDYGYVVTRRPDLKDGIDACLTEKGMQYLIVEPK